MKRIAFIIGLILLMALAGGQDTRLALVETAQAEVNTSTPIGGPLFSTLEQTAREYWGLRNVSLPNTVEVFEMADESDVAARGTEPGDQVWLTDTTIHMLYGEGRVEVEPDEFIFLGIDERITVCIIYLHERGHNAGLSHESGYQIMNPLTSYEVRPPKCVKWAKLSFTYDN